MWEGELQATMKEVRLESRPERKNRVCLPDVPGQGIPLGRGDISEGSLAISLCFAVLGPRNIKKGFVHQLERTRLSVYGGMSSEG